MKLKISMVGFITVGMLAAYYFSSNESKTQMPNKSFSTAKSATAITKFNLQPVVADQILEQKVTPKAQDEIKVLKKEYLAFYHMPAEELGQSLSLLEQKHSQLLAKMRHEGKRIDPMLYVKPRLAIALSYYLDQHYTELSFSDVQALQFSNREWYLVKTFSESKDFKLLLQRNELSAEFLQLDYLASHY